MRGSNVLLLLFSSMIVIALFVQQGCYLRVHFLIGITLYIYCFGAAERYACTASLTESRINFCHGLDNFSCTAVFDFLALNGVVRTDSLTHETAYAGTEHRRGTAVDDSYQRFAYQCGLRQQGNGLDGCT